MRGEHLGNCETYVCDGGSSPHARGTLWMVWPTRWPHRIIPACAGNTYVDSFFFAVPVDHPRMRGEHLLHRRTGRSIDGSSPHARGTPRIVAVPSYPHRIIPACAGNTSRRTRWDYYWPDHPRMRGEHVYGIGVASQAYGSSPHARGTRGQACVAAPAHRIIPACAGNTCRDGAHSHPRADHPRMRGEHVGCVCQMAGRHGSSPHARGTPRPLLARALIHRIIPACAGNTGLDAAATQVTADHPRMRGEHVGDYPGIGVPCGSSPHARGTLDAGADQYRSWRIIPACAGNTSGVRRLGLVMADHPRMRGEHALVRRIVTGTTGSSPHARGTRRTEMGLPVGMRIIPACAGNTWRMRAWMATAADHPRMRGEHSVTGC